MTGNIYRMILIFVIQLIGLLMADQLNKRELLDKEKDLFLEIQDRLVKLEKSIDSRKCDGTPTQGISESSSAGTMYFRWGRSSCGTNGSSLVYAGITGGSEHTHSGGAAEYLCLPLKPDLGLHMKGNQGGGYLYGSEYELADNSFLHRSYQDYEVPCAVCEVTGRTKYLMIPGKKRCPKSWTIEYSGYLMSGHHGHPSATEYICVDNNAKKAGHSTNHNGRLLYMVETICGSLPCPPYENEREVPCVVCTK